MSGLGGFGTPGSDPFTAFWGEFWKKAAAAGTPAPPPQSETFETMRKAFFDAMAQYAEEFMRSEAFLKAMKQSMDNALGWQQMMNEQLRKGLAAAQMPTREDADHVALLVRGMEERLADRLEALERRIAELEGEERPRPSPKRKTTRSAGASRSKTKK